jgi:hypothetical protein
MQTFRARGSLLQRGDGVLTEQAGAPDGRGAATQQELRAIMSRRGKGGISVMAKKTAKGGKKKGGKKR